MILIFCFLALGNILPSHVIILLYEKTLQLLKLI